MEFNFQWTFFKVKNVNKIKKTFLHLWCSVKGALSDDDTGSGQVSKSVCLSVCLLPVSHMWDLYGNCQTNQRENWRQCWYHKSRVRGCSIMKSWQIQYGGRPLVRKSLCRYICTLKNDPIMIWKFGTQNQILTICNNKKAVLSQGNHRNTAGSA